MCTFDEVISPFQATIDPSGPALDLDVPMDIVIGTIPLRNVMASYCNFLPGMQPTAPAIEPPNPDMRKYFFTV